MGSENPFPAPKWVFRPPPIRSENPFSAPKMGIHPHLGSKAGVGLAWVQGERSGIAEGDVEGQA